MICSDIPLPLLPIKVPAYLHKGYCLSSLPACHHVFSKSSICMNHLKMELAPKYLFFLVAFLLSSMTAGAASLCRVHLFRRVGRFSSHVYICECRPSASKPYLVPSRAEIPTVISEKDTIGRNNAFYRCTGKDQLHLEEVCSHGTPSQFETEARSTLQKCKMAPLTPTDKSQTHPFTYPTDQCQLRLGIYVPGPATVSVCSCKISQKRFVATGRAAALTAESPEDPLKEAKIIKKCVADTEAQLSKVCKDTPKDFEILSLQLLETCCKRLRTKFDMEKLECKAIVPDDLGPLM